MANHNHQTVKASAKQEICDKVTGDLQERQGSGVCADGNEAGGRQVGIDFHLLADTATSNIIPHKNIHSQPPVTVLDEFQGLQVPQMATSGRVMVLSYDPKS